MSEGILGHLYRVEALQVISNYAEQHSAAFFASRGYEIYLFKIKV